MSQDLPSVPDILRVVREFIDGIKEVVPDKDRYYAMCCSYLLTVAEREVAAGTRSDTAEVNALSRFLGNPLSPLQATREFAAGLRSGRFDAEWDTVTALVLHHVIDKVTISKPEHLHAMHREESL